MKLWLNLKADQLERACKETGLRPEEVEELTKKSQVTELFGYHIISMNVLSEKLEEKPFTVILSRKMIVTLVPKELANITEEVKKSIKSRADSFFVFRRIFEEINDNRMRSIKRIDTNINKVIEKAAAEKAVENVIRETSKLRREANAIRENLWEQREVFEDTRETLSEYYRLPKIVVDDLKDIVTEMQRQIEMTNSLDSRLSETVSLSSLVVSNSLNKATTMLTILVSIFALPTFIASFFGMNLLFKKEVINVLGMNMTTATLEIGIITIGFFASVLFFWRKKLLKL